MDEATLYLGSDLGDGRPVGVDADHLTTHAVCLGMTGSGKTGLGIVALEELARRGVPLLVIDLKGDMVNLLLNFPELASASFEPWVPVDEIGDDAPSVAAGRLADRWRRGLERAGLGSEDLRAVRNGVGWQLLTPGAAAVAPLDILPALNRPVGWNPDRDPDGAADRVNGVAGAILSLVDRGGDPLSDRDHVLTATVILDAWRAGRELDLTRLIGALADPPMDSLGALPLDVFYPREERMKLVLALNTLLASPAFAAWTRGLPLTMESLLGSENAPRASIVSVAHLDERQRLFVIGLLVAELVAWMRRQPASSGLRALVYMDEVYGILPPHPANPPTKLPLLTLFKQGRAFGVGAWLATQNPVDLDYKALGNAGIKLVGRLITDRDRERALEGLGLDTLEDGRDADDVVAGLGKRQFLLDDVRGEPRLRLLSSRWAMSYLRGPVTLAEMGPLVASRPGGPAEERETPRSPVQAEDAALAGSPSPPVLEQPAATLFRAASGMVARPWVAIRAHLSIHRASLDLDRRMHEVWWVPVDALGAVDWDAGERLDTLPELAERPPDDMRFPLAAPGGLGDALRSAERDFVVWRARRRVEVLANRELRLVADPGEDRVAFLARCREAADRADDATQERARVRYGTRIRKLEDRIERERDELARDRQKLASREAEEKLGVVEGLLSVLLGSRSIRSASRKAASRVRSAATKRRMRQTAEGSVTESVNELERLEDELEALADELQDEVDRIAEESERLAHQVETVAVRPIQRDIEVQDLWLVWQ
jgi:hypothetical protein